MMAKAGQARADPQALATPGAGPSSQQQPPSLPQHPPQSQQLNALQQPPPNTLATAAAAQQHLAMRNSPSLAQQQQAAMGMTVGASNMMNSLGVFQGMRPGMSIAPSLQSQQHFASQQQRNPQPLPQQQPAAGVFGGNVSQQQQQPPQSTQPQPQMQGGQPAQGTSQQQPTSHQQLVTAAAAQRVAHEQQLNRQLAEQPLENLVRYRDQFHAQRIDLENKIRALLPQGGIGPNGTPVTNLNKEIEDAIRQFRNDLYRCVGMEQTIQRHINVKQGWVLDCLLSS